MCVRVSVCLSVPTLPPAARILKGVALRLTRDSPFGSETFFGAGKRSAKQPRERDMCGEGCGGYGLSIPVQTQQNA